LPVEGGFVSHCSLVCIVSACLGESRSTRDREEGCHTVDRSLTAQLFQYFRSTGQSVARLADRDVQDQLVDAQLTHRVGALVIAFRHLESLPDGGFNEEDRDLWVMCELSKCAGRRLRVEVVAGGAELLQNSECACQDQKLD
jgi:hypothetical protein